MADVQDTGNDGADYHNSPINMVPAVLVTGPTLEELFADATFIRAKKGVTASAKPKLARV